jgi:long-subunit acyl-CoA synthetase (AMP-forming)
MSSLDSTVPGKLILDYLYGHESARPNDLVFVQPEGGGRVREFTRAQAMDEARRLATHLKQRGFPAGARIAMLTKNSAYFMIAEIAIWMAGYTTVAIFPTETADNVRFVLEHSEASLLLVGKLDTWDLQKSAVPPGLPCIEMPLAPATGYEKWADIIARSQPLQGQPKRLPDDLAMILYTSGSTGQPKGVMQTFASISAVAEGIVAYQEQQLGADYVSRALSYLPLAHCFERAWIECAAFVRGKGTLYFAESLDTFVQDLQRARPTVFISVPRLWLKFQQGVFTKMPQKKLDRLLSIPILNRIVAKKVLKGLGLDQVIQAGSGSAPIPPSLIEWYRKLGLNLLEGYAMTEDFAYSHGSSQEKCTPGHVGTPLPGVQVKLSDEGEVLIKSPGRLKGYYKRPDLDAEAFTPDGYFRTGDLGEIAPDGQLKLTGRKKELFKTGKGKYVAPAPIENKLNEHPMIEMSLVSGVGQQAAFALVMPAEALRPRLAGGDAALKAEFEQAMAELLNQVNASLPDYEQLKMIVVAREPWTMENGCLTPTMKIKRAKIESSVAGHIDRWYSARGAVVWG